tara:strand:- start:1552 stop:1935 length:384 start_codon:yes stop_codon:yes gene_type:complete
MAKEEEDYTVRKKGREVSKGTTGGSRSFSKSFDHSAVDEARKSRADAGAATAAAGAAAFAGDIGKAIAAGTTIRSLQQKAREAEAQGVRTRSFSTRSSDPGKSAKIKADEYNVDGHKTGHVFPPKKD